VCRSKYTQYLVFFVCAKAVKYPDYFVGRMVNICLDASQPPLTRQYAAAYLGSFLSRAAYIRDTTLCVDIALFGWSRSRCFLLEARSDAVSRVVVCCALQPLSARVCHRLAGGVRGDARP
jgi:hypothetical protein